MNSRTRRFILFSLFSSLLTYLPIYLFICLVEMALTVDQVFEKIGSFGRYQKLLLLGCNGLIFFWMGFAVLIMTFIAADPGWKCVANSTQCRFNGSMAASDKRRCDMNRSEWVFNDDLTSVATEVSAFEPQFDIDIIPQRDACITSEMQISEQENFFLLPYTRVTYHIT